MPLAVLRATRFAIRFAPIWRICDTERTVDAPEYVMAATCFVACPASSPHLYMHSAAIERQFLVLINVGYTAFSRQHADMMLA